MLNRWDIHGIGKCGKAYSLQKKKPIQTQKKPLSNFLFQVVAELDDFVG